MRRLLAVLLAAALSGARLLANDGPAGAPAEWWDEQTAGWLGGIVGGSLGILGAIYGFSAGLGYALRFLLSLSLVMACVGVITFFVGVGAAVSGQPYHVYFLPLLIGGVMACVFGCNYPAIKRRVEQVEFQQMSAMDS